MSTLLKKPILALAALLLTASLLPGQQPNRNVRFGTPSPAKADAAAREDYLIERPQYVLSYNAEKRIPNWVCWELKKSDIGSIPRSAFTPDPDLPRGFAKVASHVYDGGGFDRGHMCPAKDRSATPADQAAVFYISGSPKPCCQQAPAPYWCWSTPRPTSRVSHRCNTQ
jgi:endonuclease G